MPGPWLACKTILQLLTEVSPGDHAAFVGGELAAAAAASDALRPLLRAAPPAEQALLALAAALAAGGRTLNVSAVGLP